MCGLQTAGAEGLLAGCVPSAIRNAFACQVHHPCGAFQENQRKLDDTARWVTVAVRWPRSGGAVRLTGLIGEPIRPRNVVKVEAVTAGQVQAFAKQNLDPAKASVIVAGDAKAFQAELKTRRPDLEVVPVSELDLDSVTLRKGAK